MYEIQWITLLKESAAPVIASIGVLIGILFQYAKASSHQIKMVNVWMTKITFWIFAALIIAFSLWNAAAFTLSSDPLKRIDVAWFALNLLNLIGWVRICMGAKAHDMRVESAARLAQLNAKLDAQLKERDR